MNEYRLRDEIERLKTENSHLKQKLKDAENYASFRRDFTKFRQDFKNWRNWMHPRHWRNWLKFGPITVVILVFMIWPDPFGNADSRSRWIFGDDGTVTLNAVAFFTATLLPLFSLAGIAAYFRYRKWRRSRGELQ